jgi:hypothetical protein
MCDGHKYLRLLNIASSLRRRKQWALWMKRGIKCIPVPCRDGLHVLPLNENSRVRWETFEDVYACIESGNRPYQGVGFFMDNEDDFFSIDLDSCIDGQGAIRKWADEVMRVIPTYTEISPSGTGLRLLGEWNRNEFAPANLVKSYGKYLPLEAASKAKKADIMISFKGFSRMTGNVLRNRKDVVKCNIQALIRRLETATKRLGQLKSGHLMIEKPVLNQQHGPTRKTPSVDRIFEKLILWSSTLFEICRSLVKYYSDLTNSQIEELVWRYHEEICKIPIVLSDPLAIQIRIEQAKRYLESKKI